MLLCSWQTGISNARDAAATVNWTFARIFLYGDGRNKVSARLCDIFLGPLYWCSGWTTVKLAPLRRRICAVIYSRQALSSVLTANRRLLVFNRNPGTIQWNQLQPQVESAKQARDGQSAAMQYCNVGIGGKTGLRSTARFAEIGKSL